MTKVVLVGLHGQPGLNVPGRAMVGLGAEPELVLVGLPVKEAIYKHSNVTLTAVHVSKRT